MPTTQRLLTAGITLLACVASPCASIAGFMGSKDASAQGLDQLQRDIDARPEDPAAYEKYAMAAIGQGMFEDAIARLKLGIARVPDFARAYYLLGAALRTRQSYDDAAVYYRVYVALRPGETDAYFGLGKALAGMKENRAAIGAFRQYADLERRPEKQKYVEQARDEIRRLQALTPVAAPVATGPGPAAALKAEADQLKNAGRFDEAVAAYKRALAVDPTSPDIHNDLGNAYFGLKRYSEAADSFNVAVSRDPNFAIGWYNLANSSRKADRKAEAVAAYKRYMALQPNDADPWFGMAQTLKGMGDNAAAVDAYRKYLEMEKRPEQSKWIEKAKLELQALQPAATPAPPPPGKVGFDGM